MLLIKEMPRVLAVGAHPDDIELGAGGFIHRLRSKWDAVVHILILTPGIQHPIPGDTYDPRARRDESQKAATILGVPRDHVEVLNYPDCRLDDFGHEIIREIEGRLYGKDRSMQYDIVLTHAGEDTHADHRAVHESTLSAVRDFRGTVLCYQAPSTKPNGFRPTFFVNLDKEDVLKKDIALQAHASQQGKEFMKASRTLGMAANWSLFLRLSGDVYLEAFEVYKSFF